MKKIILVCAVSLLSASSVFGFNLKRSVKAAAHDVKEYVENIDTEKIEASLEKAAQKTGDAIVNAYHETKEFFEELDTEKIKTYFKKAGDATETAFKKVKKEIYRFHFSKDEPTCDTANIAEASFEKTKGFANPLTVAEIELSLKNAEDNIDQFVEKYGFVIQHLRKTESDIELPIDIKITLKPEELEMTSSEYNDMADQYTLFATSSLYLSVSQDVADNTEKDTQPVEKLYGIMRQLHDLMESQAANLTNVTNSTNSTDIEN